MRSGTGDLKRVVDTAGLSDVRLSFWSKLYSFESTDKAYVEVSPDGTNWTIVMTFVNGQDDNQYHEYQIDITDVQDALYIRFDAAMSGSGDYWYIDDVQVIATGLDAPANQSPVAGDDVYGVAEDDSLNVPAPGILADDTDADSDLLAASLLIGPSDGALLLNADGSFTYTPSADFSGADSFTYRAFDGTDYSNPATVWITVSPINDAPVAVDDAASTPQDTPVVIPLLANDSDVDSGSLTIESLTTPAHGTVIDSGNGTVTYTPDAGYIGPGMFDYVVNDGELSGSATVTMDVQASQVTLTFSNNSTTTIRDRSTTTSTVSVPTAMTILDVNVQLNISHARDQDLDVYLRSPDGTRVQLFTDVGGNGDDFAVTVLDDQASVSITVGSAPFAGTYRPEGSLAAFTGENAVGTWTLEITDDKWLYTGTLNSWSLIVTGEPMALLADGFAPAAPTSTALLTQADAERAAQQALSEWSAYTNVDRLQEIHVHVSDLPPGYLGLAWGQSLTLDVNASGAGWFVDAAPWERAKAAAMSTAASRQMDLLTVVAHELGHLLGYDHSDNVSHVMAATLPAGTRRMPGGESRILPDSLELAVASPLLQRQSRLTVMPRKLVDHPLMTGSGHGDTSADVAPWLLPVVPEDNVNQPETSVEALKAEIFKTMADEEPEMLDDVLLDLISPGLN